MWLVVGLGNKDPKYWMNRHNAGFMSVDVIADYWNIGPWKAKFQALAAEGFVDTERGREKILLLKPQTYYNESGRAVRAACDFYRIPPENVLVFHDELDLAPGKFRVKQGGGNAGNNGLKSITATLGPDFWRARIGIGHPGDKSKVTPYVLRNFSKADRNWLEELLGAIARSFPLAVGGAQNAFQTKVTHLAPAPKAENKDN